MRRKDNTYYRQALDESIEVLRDIEFIKIATAFIASDQTKMQVTPLIFSDLSTIPQTIKNVYDEQQKGIVLPKFQTQRWYKDHDAPGTPGVWEITITYHPTVTKTSMDGYATITAAGTPGYTNPGLEITYDDEVTWENIPFDPTTGTTSFNVPGICRGFKVRSKKYKEISVLASVGYNVETVVVPKLLKNIGDYAFAGCVNLVTVIFKSAITKIPDYMFYNCKKLRSTYMPASTRQIGDYAYYGCNSIQSINFPSEVYSIGKSAFESCKNLTTIQINTSVNLGESAFALCSSLNTINMGTSTRPTFVLDSTDNATSFYGVGRNGIVNITSGSTLSNWISWMSSDPGAYAHLADYSWKIWQNNVQVWP